AFQLVEFAGSRLLTLLLDTAVTFGTVWILEAVSYEQFWIFTCDVIAKIAAAVLVTIANYFLSKFWVFKKR
ncbi:MAG: GtrA family protein, partial [Clostridia bacterium]|nr:GtrA family protein [Clostridia bacterium]